MLEYRPSFEAVIEGVLGKLAQEPWSLALLKELREVALGRLSEGERPVKSWRWEGEGKYGGLMERYRAMAYRPLKAGPLVEIAREICRLEESLGEAEKMDAERVSKWAAELVWRIEER